MKNQKHIVSFSGGKDSTAMLLRMIELDMRIDEIIFCDTGKEFPQMYSHIAEVEAYIERKITRLKDDKGFFVHFEKYGWMNHNFRWCTTTLKVQHINRYLKQYKNRVEYVGIAKDEEHRTKKKSKKCIKYPLIDWGWTEKDALNYCYSKGFKWSGLYGKFSRVSCYLCPLQRIGELRVIYNEYPELWADMLYLDALSHRKFRSDYSLQELETWFYNEKRQLQLF